MSWFHKYITYLTIMPESALNRIRMIKFENAVAFRLDYSCACKQERSQWGDQGGSDGLFSNSNLLDGLHIKILFLLRATGLSFPLPTFMTES